MSGKTGRHQIPIPTGTKQGIVTILGADGERNENRSAAASIRRTLSADMSSRKWLHQNGFFFSPSPRKTKFPLSSSSSFSSSSSNNEDGEEFYHNPSQDEVWRSIQSSNNRAREMVKVEPCGSILSQKSESSLLPPPYVHPLVKRSFSSMREESLEICTESLGSETGSDCYFPSKCSIECPNKIYNYENETQKEYSYDRDPYTNLRVAKYKSVPARPFPPTAGGAHIRLQPRREDGRLILEAIPVSPRNNFRAIREGGRLVLTLVGVGERTTTEERVFYYDVEDVPQADGNEEKGLVVENSMSLSGVMMGLPEKMFVMKKFVTMANVSAAWAYKKEEEILVPQSLPQEPRVERLIPPAAGVASLNVYEYFWKNTTAGFGGLINSAPGISLTNSIISVKHKISSNNSNNNNSKMCENRDLVMKEGKKGEHYLRGCKEGPRRSLLNWEPYCIATS